MNRISDSRLRTLVLHIDDPHSQEGLVPIIPEGVTLEGLINTYAYSLWPEDKAFCAKCQKKLHRDGFTVRLSDGSCALYGSKCGADEFGQSWSEATRELTHLQNRQRSLEYWDSYRGRYQALYRALTSWEPTCEKIENYRGRFRDALPELHSALAQAVQHEGSKLTLHSRVRDVRTEEKTGRPSYTYVDDWHYIISGRTWLQPLRPTDVLNGAVNTLRDFWRLAQAETDRISNRQLDRHLKSVQDAADEMRAVDEMRRSIIEFSHSENLQSIATWATKSDRVEGRYGTEGGLLFREGPFHNKRGWSVEKGERSQFDTCISIPVPDMVIFELLRLSVAPNNREHAGARDESSLSPGREAANGRIEN